MAEECRVGRDGRVEAEQRVGVEAVQRRPAAVPVVRQLRVRAIPGQGELLPFLDVVLGYVLRILAQVDTKERRGSYTVCLGVRGLADDLRDDTHCLDPDDAFEGQVTL